MINPWVLGYPIFTYFHMIFPQFTASTWWNMLKNPGNPEHTSRDSCWSNTSRSRAWVWNFVTWFFSHLPEVGILLKKIQSCVTFPSLPVFLAHNYRRFLYAILVVGLGNLQAFSTFALPTLPRKRRTLRNGLFVKYRLTYHNCNRDQQGSTYGWHVSWQPVSRIPHQWQCQTQCDPAQHACDDW